ncbi:MAG: DAK2 domain-containing protein, partial [Clostridia bacterium]|nr:DAK2 domain-containing protein [Clostridia bacterium]
MHERIITTDDLFEMFRVGAMNLSANSEYVNSINVFPIPDGDTGTNMNATISGAVKAGQSAKDKPIGEFSQIIAKAAVMNARGNSGVILSQFIKGMSLSLAGRTEVDVKGFADAMNAGWAKSYEVVANPTEGTMLTVMREAGEKASEKIKEETTIGEYIFTYCNEARASLMRTPELLPVLKKAGVIDSGGAGFTYIAEGMMKAINGEEVSNVKEEVAATSSVDTSAFNADSELTFGYCTEFILQLQNSKVDTASFPLSTVSDYLESVGGESVVAFKDDDIIKVHVHTFDPGKILSEMRKYGEFLTVKIENMNLQHSEHIDYFEQKQENEGGQH